MLSTASSTVPLRPSVMQRLQESFPPHLLAQKLNNRGVQSIEDGRYDRAISTLVRALKLSEQVADEAACPCRHCTLESSMAVNQTVPRVMQCSPTTLKKKTFKSELDGSDHGKGGYIYRKPIRVSPKSMQEGHSMGVTLSLIVIFNLALAHHLSSLERRCATLSQAATAARKLRKSLQLYELAYQLQLEGRHDINNLRFTMIVANNLSEIHRYYKNYAKHELCLQHLLSTIMYLVDCRVPHRFSRIGWFLSQHYQFNLAKELRKSSVVVWLQQHSRETISVVTPIRATSQRTVISKNFSATTTRMLISTCLRLNSSRLQTNNHIIVKD